MVKISRKLLSKFHAEYKIYRYFSEKSFDIVSYCYQGSDDAIDKEDFHKSGFEREDASADSDIE